jgi:thiol-disulfide isomerase/thioredoxin
MNRREALVLGAAGVAAATAGVALGPLFLQWQSGAAALLSARYPDLSGRVRQLGEWKGRVAVFNFWATWCAPCREEVPLLVDFRARLQGRGVEVVGIGADQAAKIVEFARTYRVEYPLLVADPGVFQLLPRIGNRAALLPYTVVLDPRGSVILQRLGALKEGDLEAVATPFLR